MATPRFTLRQLEIFSAVMHTGQVNSAARHLFLSQAAVSQALRELAAALGVRLFERRGRELVPTSSAHQLLRLSADPVDALTGVQERLTDDTGPRPLAGPIRIAASNTIARYVLPVALARVLRAHPQLELTLVSGNSAEVERKIVDLAVDVGFVEGPTQRTDTRVAPWRTDTLQVIAPANYPCAQITLDTLARHNWVMREPGSGTRSVFEHNLALLGYAPPPAVFVLDDTGAIVRAVAAGAGLACVSRLAAAEAHARGAVMFVGLPGVTLDRPLWRVCRARRTDSPSIRRFLNALGEQIEAR